MIKIAMIGAGSAMFAKTLLTDILAEFKRCAVALCDIDGRRLANALAVAEQTAAAAGAAPALSATLDRKAALAGADFVIVMIQVGGYRPATLADFEIPKKYGLRQTIGDTAGIGGIMRGLRTAPALCEIARDMIEICPDAWLLQYANPMAINCLALARFAPAARVVGLCHSIPNTTAQIARDLGEAPADLAIKCGGINHLAFFTAIEKNRPDGGREDLYPRLREIGRRRAYGRNEWGCADHIRYAAMRYLGYFVAESSEHFAEYVPWFIKRDSRQLMEEMEIPLDEYPRRCRILEQGGGAADDSRECAAALIKAIADNKPARIYANVPNRGGRIANLPEAALVELACEADGGGVRPLPFGALPLQIAALLQSHIGAQSLVIEALASGRRDAVYQAAMLDPHTGAELTPDEIIRMVDELIAAHGDLLPKLI